MGFFAAILLFVFGSIWAALDGDFSGLAAIGKFLLYAGLFFFVAWMVLNPVALVIGILVAGLIVCAVKQK